jgi:hypothetical protein
VSRAGRPQEESPPRRGQGIKPGASAPGPDAKTSSKPQRGGGSDRDAAFAPSGLPEKLESPFLGLKPQALRLSPFGAKDIASLEGWILASLESIRRTGRAGPGGAEACSPGRKPGVNRPPKPP